MSRKRSDNKAALISDRRKKKPFGASEKHFSDKFFKKSGKEKIESGENKRIDAVNEPDETKKPIIGTKKSDNEKKEHSNDPKNLAEAAKKRFSSENILKIKFRKRKKALDKEKPAEDGGVFDPETKVEVKPRQPSAFDIFKKRVKAYRDAHGRTGFEVEGVNFGRLLSLLSEFTSLKSVKTGAKKLSFVSPSKDRGKIIALLDKLCYSYKINKTRGIIPFGVNFAARFGLVAGVIAAIAVLSVYPKFVTRITIEGEASQAVNDILSAYGIKRGAFLGSLNEKSVSNELLKLDGVAFASVEKHGTHVYVYLRGELANDNYIDFSGEPVTAKKRAGVTRVIVTGGTAEVKYGDVVEPGDVLIGGYVLVGEEKAPVPAGGEVYGKVYHEKTTVFPDVEIVKTRGRVKTYTRLGMFSKTPKPPAAPFASYELETTVSDFGFLLPFSIYTYRFYEVSAEERANKRTEEEMKSETLSSLLTSLPPDVRVLDAFCEVERIDGATQVRAVIETEELIS